MDLRLQLKFGLCRRKVGSRQKYMGCLEVFYFLSLFFFLLEIIDDDEETFEKALDAGMDSIIKKPI